MKRGMISLLSQLYHLIDFGSRKQESQFENGVLIISVDVDVGSKSIAEINRNQNDANVHDLFSEFEVGEIEEMAVPPLIQLLEDLEIPATFAIRGQLADTDGSMLELFKRATVKHDIGAHGYSHRVFTSLSKSEAENELRMISKAMKKFQIEPKSFVFPKNRVAHLSLLEKYGYKCYRGIDGFKHDRLYIEKHGQLYDVHSSFFLGWSSTSLCLNRIIDISTRRKLPFHIWFHPLDLGRDKPAVQKKLDRFLLPLLKHAKKKEKEGKLSFETMTSAVEKLEETNS